MDLRLFGSRDKPLRASSLPKLVGCPLSLVVKVLGEEDFSSKAADTGSAMHKAAAIWHAKDHSAELAVAVMHERKEEYPLADMDEAERIFSRYIADERNTTAKLVLIEQKVEIVLPPLPEDQTGQEIYISGTLDQVREAPGNDLGVCDIKTGDSMDGVEMLLYYAMQQAAYQYGAAKLLGKRVRTSSIIRTRDYFKRGGPGKVFYEAPWTDDNAEQMLLAIRRLVASIRNGAVWSAPGGDCFRCSLANPANCVPMLHTIGVR